jgi:hypothetical protein
LFAAVVLVLAGAPARALEWSETRAVTASVTSDENIFLTPGAERRTSHSSVAASLDVSARNPGFTFGVSPSVVALRYGDAAVDRTNVLTTYRLGLARPRHDWTLGGSYTRESTLTSEFESSGLLDLDVERTYRQAFTAFNRILGPKGRIGLSASASRAGFDAEQSSPFDDYGYNSVQLSYSRQTTTRSSWRFSVGESLFDSTPGGLDSTQKSVQAVWSRRFSPVLDVGIGAGAIAIERVGGRERDQSASYTFSVTRTWPRWVVQAAGGRDVSPQSLGVATLEDSLTVNAQRRLSDRVNIGLAWRGARGASTFLEIFDFDREYEQTSATVDWRITRRLNLNVTVLERAQVSTLLPRGSGYAGSVSVNYRSG